MAYQYTKILGPVDTAFYYVDRDETPMNIGAMTIFEGKLDFDKFLKLIDTRIHHAPLYQQRVIQAPLHLGAPTWMFDPDFYVENHVFKLKLDAPGTDEQLRALAGHLVSGMLDRDKPLWEIYMIEGLDNDRTAVFFKVHHCMVDGLAAVEIFTILMDLTSDEPALPRKPLYNPPDLPSKTRLIEDSIAKEIPHKWGVLKKLGADALNLASIVADKEKRRKMLVGVANLLNDNLTPIKPLPINGKNSGRITLAWVEFSLAEVRAIKSNQGGSVNDVMLTVLAGGLDSFLRDSGQPFEQEFVRLLVPVNMRVEKEKSNYGNRISVLPVDIPFGLNNPLERLQRVIDYTTVMKDSSLAYGLDMILTLPSLAPAAAQPLVWAIAPAAFSFLAHSWCTNVAGPQIPVYLMGHKMLHGYGYFPLNPSMGLATVIMSYNQRITMTLVADAAIVPEVTILADHLEKAYLALRQAAKIQPIEPILIETRAAPKPAEPEVKVEPPEMITGGSRAAPYEKSVGAHRDVPTTSTPITTEQPAAITGGSRAAPYEKSVGAYRDAPATSTPITTEQPAAITGGSRAAPYEKSVGADRDVPATSTPIPAEQPAAITGGSRAAPYEESERTPASAELPVSKPEPEPEAPAVNLMTAYVDPPIASPEWPIEMPAPEKIAAGNGNGHAAAMVVEAVEITPVIVNSENGKSKPTLFSEEWAQAYRESINGNPNYYKTSKKWQAGSLAFIMKADPRHGYTRPAAVLLDLHQGACRDAHSIPAHEAEMQAAFVIEGDYPSWMKVLNGEIPPLVMIMRGKLHLKKGSLMRLLPFTLSAQELIRSAQVITT